ncbi:MAG: NfeD family protein [Thermoleophilia bacterium]|nr:NfeD family protein [Thermoleophilia bacterium]
MDPWLIWLIVAAALVGIEVATLTLVMGMAAVGALGAMVTALVGGPVWAQMVVFIVITVAMLLVVRPMARRHLHTPAQLRTGTAALVGASGVVLDEVTARDGRVRINGEVWSARAYDGRSVIAAGRDVHVVKIDGATALIMEEE